MQNKNIRFPPYISTPIVKDDSKKLPAIGFPKITTNATALSKNHVLRKSLSTAFSNPRTSNHPPATGKLETIASISEISYQNPAYERRKSIQVVRPSLYIEVPQYNSPDFSQKISILLQYLTLENPKKLKDVVKNKQVAIFQMTRYFDYCDPSTPVNIEAATNTVKTITKMLFPTNKPNFKWVTNFDTPTTEQAPMWYFNRLLYQLLLSITRAYSELKIIDAQLVSTLLEYSNTLDPNEKKAIYDILQAYYNTHDDKSQDLYKILNNKLQLILNEVENPSSASTILNLLAYITSTSLNAIHDIIFNNMLMQSVFPLIKLNSFSLFSASYLKLIGKIIPRNYTLRESFFDQLHKFWPKSSGRKEAHYSQICSMLLMESTIECFGDMFNRLSKIILKLLKEAFSPAVESLLETFAMTFSRDILSRYGEMITMTLYDPLYDLSNTFFNEKVKEKATTVLSKLTAGTDTNLIKKVISQNSLERSTEMKKAQEEKNKKDYESWMKIINSTCFEKDDSVQAKNQLLEQLFLSK